MTMRAYLLHDVEIEVVEAMRTLDPERVEMVHRFTTTAAELAAEDRALKAAPTVALVVSNHLKRGVRGRARAKRPALRIVGWRP
jgi:hypothetical protein